MAYLIFVHDRRRNINLFVEALAVTLLQPSNNFEMIDAHSHPKKANDKTAVNQLVTLRLSNMRLGPKLIIKTKNEIRSDKHLVSTFKEFYIGCISGNLDKATLLKGSRLDEIVRHYDRLKNYVNQQKNALSHFRDDLNFSEQEIADFQSVAENCVSPLHNWIDLHAKATMDEINALPPFLKRGF